MTDAQTGPDPARTPIDPQKMAEQTADFFLQAAHDEHLGERLSLAATVVHIHYTDDVGVTLWFDRTPIEAEPKIVGTAEVQLWGSADKFWGYVRGERHLAMAIADGEVEFEGPVRKFLRIMPILRSFDFSMWDEQGPTTD